MKVENIKNKIPLVYYFVNLGLVIWSTQKCLEPKALEKETVKVISRAANDELLPVAKNL